MTYPVDLTGLGDSRPRPPGKGAPTPEPGGAGRAFPKRWERGTLKRDSPVPVLPLPYIECRWMDCNVSKTNTNTGSTTSPKRRIGGGETPNPCKSGGLRSLIKRTFEANVANVRNGSDREQSGILGESTTLSTTLRGGVNPGKDKGFI